MNYYFLVTFDQHCTKEYMIAPQNDYNQTANFTFLTTCNTKDIHRNVLNYAVCQILTNLLQRKSSVF